MLNYDKRGDKKLEANDFPNAAQGNRNVADTVINSFV